MMRKGLPSTHLTVLTQHSHKTELWLQRNTSWHLSNVVHWASFYQGRRKFHSTFLDHSAEITQLKHTLWELTSPGIFIKANTTIIAKGASCKEVRGIQSGRCCLFNPLSKCKVGTALQLQHRNRSGWTQQCFHKASGFRHCPGESWNHSSLQNPSRFLFQNGLSPWTQEWCLLNP